MICVTNLEKKTKRWKKLVEVRGLAAAYNLHFKYKGEIPDSELETPVTNRDVQDPFIREKYFFDEPAEGFLKSSTVLSRIAASNHPLNKLANYLLPLLTKINDPTIQLVSEGDFAGIYIYSENHINMKENAFFKGIGSEPTIIHEVMHALTYDILRKNSAALEEFKKIYNYLKPMFPAYNEETNEGTYALKDLDEFVVALFSDAKFINELLKIPAIDTSKDSIFKEIFDFIVGLFNISENDSIYRQAFNVASNLLEDASVSTASQYEETYMNEPQATNPLLALFNEKEVGKSYSLMNNVWKKEYNRIIKTYGIEPNVIKDNYSAKVIGINPSQSFPKFKPVSEKKQIENIVKDNVLISFLKGFDFDVQGFNNEYGYTNEQTLDLLNRVLYVDVNNIEDSFKNQFVDFIQFFLKYNPEYIELNKTYSKEQIKNSFLENLEIEPEKINIFRQFINDILEFFRSKRDDLNYYTNDIINRIYNNDTTVLDYYQGIRPGSSSSSALSSFEKNILKDSQAAEIINGFANDFSLTGSIVLGEQGDVFTSDTNPFHDIDYQAPAMSKEQIESIVYEKFPNSQFFRSIPNEDYTTYTYIVPTGNYRIENLDIRSKEKNGKVYKDVYAYDVVDENNEVVGTYRMEKVSTGKLTALGNQEKKKIETETGVKAKIVDFFQSDKPKDSFVKNINGTDIKMALWTDIMKAKLEYVRPKDVHDLLLFNRQKLIENQKQLPKFKPTPINTLNDLEVEQFKSVLETSLQVGGTINFNYWSESTSQEISEKSIQVLSIEDNSFTGKYADGTERVFRFKNVISKAVPGKYEVHEQEYFKNNLEVGKTVSVNSNGLAYSGTIVEIGDEGFTIADDKGDSYTLKYDSLDKENHERKILERASEMKSLIEDLIDRFSKNAKSQFQIERIAILQQALSYLDNYKDLGDLVKFMKIIQSSIYKSRALMEDLANPKELPDNEADKMAEINRRLSMLSFLKDYIESMKSFDRISFAIAESNSSEQLKNVSAQLTAEIQYASRKYYEVAIPNIADWLWMCFPKKLNSQLALIKEEEWTKERLIQELMQPRNDLDFLNSYGVPVANANDIITGLFSKAIKKVLQYARESHIKMEKALLPFFKKVQDTGVKMEEVYKKFYTIKQMETEEDVEVDGVFIRQKVVKNVRVFIEQYNLQSYYDTVKDFTSKIRQINDKLRDLELTGSTNEIKALNSEKKKIAAQLENYQKLTANNYSGTQMNEMMDKLKTSNVPKYLEYRNKFYRVGTETDKSHKVITESGDTIYYNYNGRFYKPNREAVDPNTGTKIFLTNEYQNLMKESQETIDLYTEMKKIYDEKNNLLPEHMKMKGVIPVFYEKKLLKDISKSIKNIGNYNDSQELRKKEKKVYTKLNGEPYQSIPVGYTRILDIEESSDNIMQSLLLWANDVEMYKAKNDVIGSVENLTNVLEKNNPLEEGETYSSRTNKRAEVIKKYTNQVLYGETRAGDKWWDRVFDYMGKFTALTRMFIKPSSALNNLIIGNYAALSEAIGGRNFSTKELWKAHKNYVDLVATNKTKLNNMLLTLDAIQGRFKDEIGSDFQTFQDTFGFNTAFSLNNTAEHQIQSVSMLALLEKWGIEIPEDGIFEVNKLPENFLGTLHELNKSNNGVYAESDRLYYQDESLFRLFLQFRKYIIPTFRSRYSGMTEKGNNKYRIDVEAGTVELGYYRAFGEFVYNNIVKIKNLPNLIANYNSLNEVEKEGVWRGLVDGVAFASISLLFLPLAGADDDDWDDDEHGTFENLIHWESIYQLARLKGDIGTTIPGFGFNDQSRLVNQPFAGVSTATQLAKIVGLVFDFEEDDEGNVSIWKQYDRDYGKYEKGDLKILQPISKLNPFDNPYEDMFPHVQYNDFKGASR